MASKEKCFFVGNGLTKDPTIDAKTCGQNCVSIIECTHYTWNRGICILQQENVSFADARFTVIPGAVCGIKIPNLPKHNNSTGTEKK